MNGKECFVQGNEACVRGALYAGLKFFAGYPITPSTEIPQYFASFAANGQVGFLASQRVDGKLILSEAVKTMAIKGSSAGA